MARTSKVLYKRFLTAAAAVALVLPTIASAAPANCFDYYRFGSVTAEISPQVRSTVSGTSLTFSGTIENENDYPVVDGTLFVKIFRDRSANKDSFGPDVLEQFVVKEGIALPAHGKIPVEFMWQVPAYAVSGNYRAATFFVTSEKFNLLGLSFTDDVVGNSAAFKVVGEQEMGVKFNKTKVTVNGAPLYFAAFPPRVPAGKSVVLEAEVVNTSGRDETVPVTWKLYRWDSMSEENLLLEFSEKVTVPANGKAVAKYTVDDSQHPVYLAVATLNYRDTRSILNIRFVRDGVDIPRLNFPGITTYPLKADTPAAVFSCLHNSGLGVRVPNGKLELKISDASGREIHTASYEGDVTGSMMGVAESFTPKRDYDSFTLDARLYSGDQVVDEAHIVYECSQLSPTGCDAGLWGWLKSHAGLAILLAGLFIVAALWAYRREPIPQMR